MKYNCAAAEGMSQKSPQHSQNSGNTDKSAAFQAIQKTHPALLFRKKKLNNSKGKTTTHNLGSHYFFLIDIFICFSRSNFLH